MGVHGLTTYVQGNKQFFQDVKLRDTRLVIDGCSLFFQLYFDHGLDQQHGGDYDAFFGLLFQFLSALAACSIQPYVVLDGGMDPSDKKLSTLRQRMQSKIKEGDSLAHGRRGSVLPLLTSDVFIQVLSERGVPLAQCPAEADWEIACLAHQWDCPVLTNDSDFFIFDLPGGYLPLRFFQWTNVNGKGPGRFIPACLYTVNGLCGRFGGMNRELLPLCAVLAGNDYATPEGTNTLLSLLDLTAPPGSGGRRKTPRSLIEGLLRWLSSFPGVGEALEEVERVMAGEGRGRRRRVEGERRRETDGLSALLRTGMREYQLTPDSTLARWFSGGLGGQAASASPVPEWMSQAAWRGALPPMVLDVLVHRRFLLNMQVENSRLPSSHCSARAIRQAVYGILLQARTKQDNREKRGLGGSVKETRDRGKDARDQEVVGRGMRGRGGRGRGGRGRGGGQGGVGGGRESQTGGQGSGGLGEEGEEGPGEGNATAPICVEEYDRQELNLRRSQVEPLPIRVQLTLGTLDKAPLQMRLGLLLDVLGVKESVLEPLLPHFRLPVAVTCFWRRETRPAPSLCQALLLGMVHGELARTNLPAGDQTEWRVWSCLDRQRARRGERRGLDVDVAHAFSQWQACLKSALYLNQLLCLPLPEPYIAWLFSGSLVHGLAGCVREGRPVESFLDGAPLSGQLYSSLLAGLDNGGAGTFHHSSYPGRGRQRRSRRGRRGRGGGGERGLTPEEINNRFALLMSEEQEDEE